MSQPQENMLTVKQVAERMNVDEKTVRNWIQRGDLRAINIGRLRPEYRIRPVDLEYFIDIVHEIGQDVYSPLDVRERHRAEPLGFQDVHQAHGGKDAVQLMAEHTLIIFLLEFTLYLLIEPGISGVIAVFGRDSAVILHQFGNHF